MFISKGSFGDRCGGVDGSPPESGPNSPQGRLRDPCCLHELYKLVINRNSTRVAFLV